MNLPEAETMTNEGPTPVEPKKGSGGKIAAVVIVIILIAAIGLYLLYKPAPPVTPPTVPLVVLARSGLGSGCELDHCDARVESVSIAYGHELYKVSALNGSTVAIAPTPLSTSPVSGGGLSLQLNDVSVAGQLNANDTFRLSGAAPGLNYTVRLLWASDNGVLASVTFDYPLPKPTLVLAPAGCSADYCDAVVQSVTLTYTYNRYEVVVLNGTTLAIAATALTTSPVTGGGLTLQFNETWYPGELNTNDSFRLSGAAPGFNYTVRVLWTADGGELGSVTVDYPPPKPGLDLSPQGCSGADCDAQVQNVTNAYPYSRYHVAVLNGTTVVIGPTVLSPSSMTGGGLTLQFNETWYPSELNTNDSFRLSGVFPGSNYTLRVLWAADGTLVANVTLVFALAKPTIALMGGGCVGTNCTASVAAASASYPLAYYRVTVLNGTTEVISAALLVDGVVATGGGLTFSYTDLGGEGNLTAGDTLQLDGVGPGNSYTVVLSWGPDGSPVASTVFNT